MQLKRSWAAIVAAVTLSAPFASAQDEAPRGPSPEQLFEKLDTNGDGKVTAEELSEDQRKFFDRLIRIGDKNEDGQLTKEEFLEAATPDRRPVEAGRPGGRPGARGAGGGLPNADEFFNRLDVNKDGKISKSEIPAPVRGRMEPFFQRLGKDEITREDFAKMSQMAQQAQPGIGNGELFRRFDANGDGKVTVNEAPARAKPLIRAALQRAGKGPNDGLTIEDINKLSAQRGRPPAGRRPEGEGRRPEGEGRRPEGEGRRPEGEGRRPEGEGRRPEGEGRRPEGEGRRPEGRPGFGPPRPPMFFERLDTNADGRISKEELSKITALFDELDENNDGELDPRELLGGPPPRRPEDRGPRDGRPEGRGPDAAAFAKQFFDRADTNKDGKLTREEVPERVRENFDRLDIDGDGAVSLEEFSKARPEGRREGGRFEGRRPEGERPEGEGRRRPESE